MSAADDQTLNLHIIQVHMPKNLLHIQWLNDYLIILTHLKGIDTDCHTVPQQSRATSTAQWHYLERRCAWQMARAPRPPGGGGGGGGNWGEHLSHLRTKEGQDPKLVLTGIRSKVHIGHCR